ncbi:MAG: ribosome assembly factor SBDS, partial [Thermoplasmata archaeon]|nr:ribosome assembly factor SBDS [Thermoplasmata archaeon]
MVKDRMIQKEYADDLMDGMVIARLESHGNTFEIIVEADAVDGIKTGKIEDILKHMPEDSIFKDAKKGERAPEDSIKTVFDTDDVAQIAQKIIAKGQVQLTTEQRKQMTEEKRKQVITMIAREVINPQTKMPHPPQRIELAMDEANVQIDPFKSVNIQVKEVVDALRSLLPISFEKVRMAVKVSAVDYGRCFGDIKNFGTVVREEWQNDGSWIGVVEMP